MGFLATELLQSTILHMNISFLGIILHTIGRCASQGITLVLAYEDPQFLNRPQIQYGYKLRILISRFYSQSVRT